MSKTARCLTFTSEASQPLGIGSDFRRQNFDSDTVAEQDVAGTIDCAHAAFAEERPPLVLAVENGIDDRGRIGLEHLTVNRAEANAVVVFCFAGSAVFHSGVVSLTCLGAEERTVGADLRGRPCMGLERGAATEGRPYSTFYAPE